MRALWKNSLLFRSIAMVVVIFGLISLLFVAVTAVVTHKRAHAAASSRLSQLLDTVESTVQVACFVGDRTLADEVAQGLLSNSEVLAVSILADDKELVLRRRAGVTEVTVAPGSHLMRDILMRDIHSPFNPAQVIGHIQVLPYHETIERGVLEEVRFVALQLGWQLSMIALVVIGVLLLFVLRPIKAISDRLHQMDAKAGERLSVPEGLAYTEIGRLVDDVNTLAGDLVASLEDERTLRLQLEMDEKKYHAIFDHADSGIFILDGEGLLSSWNPAFTRLLEIPSANAHEGALLLSALPWENPWRLSELIRESLYDNTPVSEDLALCFKDGTRLWLNLVLSPIGDSLLQGVVHDITARKQAEEQLQLINQTLEQRVAEGTRKNIEQERILTHQARHAAMGEMIGNIAHQWRQPLNTLGLIVQNIIIDYQDGLLDDKSLAEYHEKALGTVQEMSQTIDDFRNFFKPNRQEEIFSLSKALQETLKLIEASLKNNAIALTVDCPESLKIFGLPNEFTQVMLNLLVNAKDALLEKNGPLKKITVSAHAQGSLVVVGVRDNGGGIPDDIMDKIFDPYFTSKESGTGIGLYMTKVIVEQHMHGQITCCNTEEGAEFTLFLPKEKDQA